MAKQNSPEGFVKKETMLISALIALVVGFLAGILYSASQSGPTGVVQNSAAPVQQQQSGLSNEQATAILQLEQEVAVNPSNVEAWTQLGHVYFDTNNPPKAIRAYEKALELSPGNPNVLTDLGVMYRRSGQPGKALEVFDKAMASAPNHEQSRFNKGVVLLNDMNDKEGAIKAWEELLKVNPNAMAPNGQPIAEIIKGL